MSESDTPTTGAVEATAAQAAEPTMEVAGRLADQSGGQPQQMRRPARGLIGWMPKEGAQMFLNGNMGGVAATTEQVSIVEAAQRTVGERTPVAVQSEVVTDAPPELLDHINQLRADAAAASMLNEGWQVSMVDLTRVCGFQPVVFSDSAADRARGLDGSDLAGIAKVTLPIGAQAEFTQSFDPGRNSWILSSRNPNLQVLANFAGPVATQQGTVPAFGFLASVTTSFMQVAEFEGRYFLRDGYHRAMGLLGARIHCVPAFVKPVASIEELIPKNINMMLPQAAYRGPRPPLLPDYLDDLVAASAKLPAVQKLIVIHALELSTLG
jgi:hypothetical protein